MVPQKLQKYLQWISLSSLALTCLAASPFVTFDAFNPAKLLVLSTCAGIALGLLFVSSKSNELRKYKSVFIVAGIFFASLLASSIAAKQAFATTFYGISGRNTGLLAYLSLAVIFVSASIASDRTFLDKLKKLMLIVGVLSQIYAWYQILGFDTAPWCEATWIKSFFANPNFLSAFLGITAAFSNAMIFSTQSSVKNRVYAAAYSAFTLFTMFKV